MINETEIYFLKRRKKGINQQQIATYLNISQSMVSRLEKGTRVLSDDKLQLYKHYIDTYREKK